VDPTETAKYLLVGKEPPLNLFYLLDVIYAGIQIELCGHSGVATLSNAEKKFCEQVPATLTSAVAGQLSKDGAITFAIECCRATGVAGFCYSWTRRAEPIFSEIVDTLGPAFGLWDWRLAQAWRFERADVYEDVGYLLLCFTAAVPQAYRQEAVVDILFNGPWQLSTEQARTVGALAQKLQVYAVRCADENARLYVCEYAFYVTQRDWAVLALVLLFTDAGNGIGAIMAARRAMGLVEEGA
jgi:hypothetical protein